MKRLSKEKRNYQFRKMSYARKATRKKRLLLRKKKLRLRNNKKPLAKRIIAPKYFLIEYNNERKLLVKFLAELRNIYASNKRCTLIIDFSKTARFISSGTLLFYSELMRLIEYGKGKVILRCKAPENEQASQVLEQIGLYNICSHPTRGAPTFDNVVHWRVARGHLIDNSICAPVIEEFEGQLAAPLVDGIIGGLSEAMANAVEHAYLDVRKDGLEFDDVKDWWMFSQSKDGYLSVVFCDLGVGIPVTLPIRQPKIFKMLEKLGMLNSDSAAIEEAIKESKTRTSKAGRGHGLGEIIDVVEKIPNADAVVYSNYGGYSINNAIHSKKDYNVSILGTIVCWRVPLDEASKNGD